jgi:2-keto-4-pentenoate hydratase/2-oxohepta-3-ene-1,7-dioic acid hydratase in catechol pathway
MGFELGVAPAVFMKPLQTLVPPDGTVVLPPTSLSSKVEHEGELAVVIGKRARNVKAADAAGYVLGFTCANDVSARDLQKKDTHITRGKGFDTFCPLGPWIETDVDLTAHLAVSCSVNGEERQAGSTRELIYDIPTLIEHLTEWTTLEPGDVILTGSPAGTGPLEPGDAVEVSVEGVGTLRHTVAAANQ